MKLFGKFGQHFAGNQLAKGQGFGFVPGDDAHDRHIRTLENGQLVSALVPSVDPTDFSYGLYLAAGIAK
jgi:hypothetical protein